MYSIKVVHTDNGIVRNDFFEGNKVSINTDKGRHINSYLAEAKDSDIESGLNTNISMTDNIEANADIILGVIVEEREDFDVRNILCYRNATVYLMNDLGNTIDSWSVKG